MTKDERDKQDLLERQDSHSERVINCTVSISISLLQSSAKVGAPGLVKFFPAVAHHFCLKLPAAFTQPEASTLADLCNE